MDAQVWILFLFVLLNEVINGGIGSVSIISPVSISTTYTLIVWDTHSQRCRDRDT